MKALHSNVPTIETYKVFVELGNTLRDKVYWVFAVLNFNWVCFISFAFCYPLLEKQLGIPEK